MATCSGCAFRTGKGQLSFPSTSGVLKSEGLSERELRRRTSITESIGFRAYGGRWLLPQNTTSVLLSHNFVPKKSVVVPQASNSRFTASQQVASKGKNNREPDNSLGEARSKRKNEKQAKTTSSPLSSLPDDTATTPQVVVKDGFAGLSAFKAQLEKEKRRISRGKLNDVNGEFLARQKKQAELRRSRQAVGTAPTSQGSDLTRETSSSKSSSSDGPFREDATTALISVTNLAKEVTKEEFEFVMQSTPEVTSWKYLTDSRGQCLGYGFCEVQAESDLEAIIEDLSQQVLHGKNMKAALSEAPGKYKQSLDRHAKPAVTSKGQNKWNPGVRTQAGLRDVWKSRASSMDIETTEMRYEDSSQSFSIRHDGKLDHKLTDRTPDMEELENFTPASMERDATETGSSSTGAGSSQGIDGQLSTKLSGKSVLEALQRAAALQHSTRKPRRRKGRSGSSTYGSDSDSEDDSKQDPLPPLVFKYEWASRIQELEHDLKQLRLLS